MADEPESSSGTPAEVTFNYIKSPQYRTVHVDGAIGGPTPRGNNLYVSLYSERVPVPQQTVHALKGVEGQPAAQHLGDEYKDRRVQRSGIVRELEVGVVLDLDAAVNLAAWLSKHVEKMKAHSSGGKEDEPA